MTTWSPLRHWGVKPGDRVGVVGFGGLGEMAVKLARALGAAVTVFTTSPEKVAIAEALGASAVVEGDAAALAALRSSFDLVLSTVPQSHDLNPFIPLLRRDRAIVVVGALDTLRPVANMEVAAHRRSVSGSLIGSIAETQEVLDFCAEHAIAPNVQVIPISRINDAYAHVIAGDVRFRYVIDIASLRDGQGQGAALDPQGARGPLTP